MQRLARVAVVLVCSCSGSTKLGGLIADVTLEPGAKASCVDIRVKDGSGKELGSSQVAFPAGKTEVKVGIGSGGFPQSIVISAAPLWSPSGCDQAKTNGPAVEKMAMFPIGATVSEVPIALAAPTLAMDTDHDGFVAAGAGGVDCDDMNVGAFPGATEDCMGTADLDCDGLAGCADTQCTGGCVMPADRLAFTTAALTVDTNTCSGALTVQSRGSGGTAVPLPANTAVMLAAAPAAGVTFYSDASCTTAVTQLSSATAASDFTFYFRAMMSGSIDVTASSGTLMPATQTETVRPPAASQLAFATPSRSVTAGGCTMVVDVESRDSGGVARPVAADVLVALAVAPSGAVTFHPDASCAMPGLTSVTIATGQTKASFYVKGLQVGMPMLSAMASGYSGATQPVVVGAGTPAKLSFVTAPQGIGASTCSSVAQVRAEDASGNAATLGAPITLDLTVSGLTGLTFYSDATCTVTTTTAALAAPAGSLASFYFRGTTMGTATLRAGVAGNALTAATQTANIGVGPPNRLAFTTPPYTVAADTCSPAVTVEVRDSANFPTNPPTAITVALDGTPDAGFSVYSDGLCNSALSGPLTITGSPSSTFHFKAQRVPTQRIDARATNLTLTGANQTHTITAGAASRLNITTAPLTVTAAACSPLVHVEVLDPFGNLTPVTNLPVAFMSSSPGAAFYAPAAGCGTAAPAAVTTGDGGFDFRFIGMAAGPMPVTVSSGGGVTSAMQTETITAGPASVLEFSTLPRSQFAGQCSPTPLTLVTKDVAGNVVNVMGGGGLNVSLTANDGGFLFYDTSGCAQAAVSQVNIANMRSSQDFWFRGRKTGVSTITASATGITTPATQDETITPGDPTVVAITSPQRTAVVNSCSAEPINFETRDAFGNVAAVAMPVAFSVDGGASVQIFPSAACGTPVPAITVASGMSTGFFHVKGSVVGAQSVTVSAPGYTPDSQAVTIAAGVTQLAYTTAPQTKYAGECSGIVTVQTQDALGMASPVGASTVVALTARTGFTFFSDAACTLPVTQLTIANGGTTASYYFRGITGGTTTLDATSGTLTAASQAVVIIPAVRSGTCTIGNGSDTVKCNISPPLLALDRSFLVFQTAPNANNDNSAEVLARCHLFDTSNVECFRGGAPTGGRTLPIYWQVATIPTQVSVQHKNDIACSNNGTPTAVTVTNLGGTGDVFTLHSAIANAFMVDDNEHYTVNVSSNTNVDLRHSGGRNCTDGDSHDLQVVKLTGATVVRGAAAFNGNRQVSVTGLAAIATGRTFVNYSWRTTAIGNDPCERNLRGTVNGTTALVFDRAAGNTSPSCTDDGATDFIYERVQLPANYGVQSVDVQMPDGTATVNVNVPTAVDATRALVMTGSQTHSGGALGETSLSNGNGLQAISNFTTRFALNAAGNQVTATRVTSNGDVRYTLFVIELDPR